MKFNSKVYNEIFHPADEETQGHVDGHLRKPDPKNKPTEPEKTETAEEVEETAEEVEETAEEVEETTEEEEVK